MLLFKGSLALPTMHWRTALDQCRARRPRRHLGFDLVAFCMVALKHQSEANLKTFAAASSNRPLVRQTWMVSGDRRTMLTISQVKAAGAG